MRGACAGAAGAAFIKIASLPMALEQHGAAKINSGKRGKAILDALKSGPYMVSPMNRFFLALLALFAGIAAQVSPAEARVRGETEIGAVMAQRCATRAAASAQAPAIYQAKSLAPARTYAAPAPAVDAGPAVSTVLVKADRARE
jgi:hypothetical protein